MITSQSVKSSSSRLSLSIYAYEIMINYDFILIIVILIYNILQLDYVQRPSWQAQISGEKTWTLIPTPECEHVCTALNVTVSKGDISKYRYLEEGYPIGIYFKYKKKTF